MNISGNTVLITGGATGIGFALAEAFLQAGNEVLICGRREGRLREAHQKHPQLRYRVCDISEQRERQALLEWAVEHDVNVLVNNAGIQRDVDFTRGMDDLLQGESEIKINFEAPVYLSALFVPHLMGREEAAIINLTSGLAFMTSPRASVPIYIATKVAVHSFTCSLRKQLAHTRIKVFEVIPPIVDTEINPEGRAKRNMPTRGMKPEEFAPIVMKGLADDRTVIHCAPEHYPQPLALLLRE